MSIYCCVKPFFVGLIFCGGEIFHRQHGEDIVIRRPAILGDNPRPKYVHRSRLSISLDGRPKAFSKTIIGNVCAGERVTTLLLQSNCSLFTEVFGVLLRAEIDITKRVFSRINIWSITSSRDWYHEEINIWNLFERSRYHCTNSYLVYKN